VHLARDPGALVESRPLCLIVLGCLGALGPFAQGVQQLAARADVQARRGHGDVEQDDAIDRLYARYKRLTPGRMYTVTGSRVKIRQLPQR